MTSLFVFVLLFWLGLVVIGYAALVVVSQKLTWLKAVTALTPLSGLVAFMTGFAYMLPIVLVSYAGNLPVAVAAIYYGASALVGLTVLCIHRPWRGSRLSKAGLFIMFLVALDYVIYSKIGGVLTPGGDAYYHIARVGVILQQGFNLAAPFSQFAVETSYYYNVVHGIYAVGAFITGSEPFEFWRFAGAFIRSMIWVSIYCLAESLFRAVKSGWLHVPLTSTGFARLTLIFVIFVYGMNFVYAAFPGQVAVLWMHCLLLGLSYLLVHRSSLGAFAVVTSALLLPFSHPTYALMSACLVGLVLALTMLTRIQRKKETIVLTISLVVLLIGPAISKLLTGQLTSGQTAIASSAYTNLGGLLVRRVELLVAQQWVMTALVIFGTVTTLVVLAKKRKHKRLLILFGVVTLLWWFIMYVPGVLNIAALAMPLWVAARFDALNGFQYILPLLGVICLIDAAKAAGWRRYASLAAIGIFAVASLQVTYTNLIAYVNIANANSRYYGQLRELDTLLPKQQHRLNIIASERDSYEISAVRPVNVLSIGEGHMTPVAKPHERSICQSLLWTKGDMEQAFLLGADYVVSVGELKAKNLMLETTSGEYVLYHLSPVPGRVASCTNLQNRIYAD